MEEIPTMIVVAAALVDESGRVLLQRRAAGRHMAGLWEFPGGKVDPGELPETALSRELDEELGIRVDPASLIPACFASAPLLEKHMLLLLYVCHQWREEPQALDASALKWLRPDQMNAGEMPPADQPLIGLLDAILNASA